MEMSSSTIFSHQLGTKFFFYYYKSFQWKLVIDKRTYYFEWSGWRGGGCVQDNVPYALRAWNRMQQSVIFHLIQFCPMTARCPFLFASIFLQFFFAPHFTQIFWRLHNFCSTYVTLLDALFSFGHIFDRNAIDAHEHMYVYLCNWLMRIHRWE